MSRKKIIFQIYKETYLTLFIKGDPDIQEYTSYYLKKKKNRDE